MVNNNQYHSIHHLVFMLLESAEFYSGKHPVKYYQDLCEVCFHSLLKLHFENCCPGPLLPEVCHLYWFSRTFVGDTWCVESVLKFSRAPLQDSQSFQHGKKS